MASISTATTALSPTTHFRLVTQIFTSWNQMVSWLRHGCAKSSASGMRPSSSPRQPANCLKELGWRATRRLSRRRRAERRRAERRRTRTARQLQILVRFLSKYHRPRCRYPRSAVARGTSDSCGCPWD